ncbi:hypothetical protein PaVLD_ORF059R [Planktothrix phage PaV-LD]|nr:hypothetical protein PaVLD_ORF059R [Planktothrix phage PaV-LD]ADZ31566.1 hypothetical protein PaVLD_ORF059R [Planktothrix phage PaV-LD]
MTFILYRQKSRFNAPPTEIQAKLAIAQAHLNIGRSKLN